MSEEKTYLISEFAKKTGVCVDTVRTYVAKGLISDRRNPANNYRVFTDADVKKVKEMKRGKVRN